MLRMLHGKAGDERWNEQIQEKITPSEKEEICMKDAAWPVPFASGLEYNSPAHGTWNIVHTGMLLPGSHQIYVCAPNCNRGVVLTAKEMNASDRFSFVELKEEDLFDGQMEELVIDGVSDILNRLADKPSAVFLFTVCVHHFMGCDIPYIYDTLRKKFPEQIFIEAYMDPIMQKEGLTPDQKLRAALYDPLPFVKKNPGQINVIGGDFPLREESEIKQMVKKAGFDVKDLTECRTWEEYLSMAEGNINIATYPPACYGAEKLSKRLGMKYLYLPMSFSYEEIDRELQMLAKLVPGAQMPDVKSLREACDRMLEETGELLKDTPVVMDATFTPRILGLARLLSEHGIRVKEIFVDSFSPEERKDYLWLSEHEPDLVLCKTVHPKMRIYHRSSDEKILALGQKAAYFTRTPYFVNMVEGGGLFGFDGILELCRRMQEAFVTRKDTKDLVIRKGLGCESCLCV